MMKCRDSLLTHGFYGYKLYLLLLTIAYFKNICFRSSLVVCTTFFEQCTAILCSLTNQLLSNWAWSCNPLRCGQGGESRSTARLCFSAAVSDFRWRTSKIDFYKKTIAAALISGREQWTGHVRVCVHSVQ